MASRKTYHSYGFLMWLLLFLAIVLPFLILIVLRPTNLKPQAATTGFWMSWGPRGTPSSDWDTAEEFLDKATAVTGVKAVEIDTWSQGGWQAHMNDYPFNNFSIQAGQGYLVRFEKPVKSTFDRSFNFTRITSMSMPLTTGWNMISFPQGIKYTFKTAQQLCQEIQTDGGSIDQIARYNSFAPDNPWSYYTCGSGQNDFSLTTGTGYFLSSNTVFTWNLP